VCLCEPKFRDASERGLLLKAISLADESCPAERCSDALRAEWLSQFALRFPLKRELRGQHSQKIAVCRWFATAQEEIPDAVERLWRPDGEVGVARFCTVRLGTDEGFVHVLRVLDGDTSRDTKAPVFEKNFGESIEWARRFIRQHFATGPAAERVLRARLQVDRPPEDLQGGSVALAALVAFASLALRLPIQPDLVFTGVPGEGNTDVGIPARNTLAAKLRAVRAQGEKARLIAPTGSRRYLDATDGASVLLEHNWQEAICTALGEEDFDALHREASRPGPHAPARLQFSPEVLLSHVLATLFAAGSEGASFYELECCLVEWQRQDPRLIDLTGNTLQNELRKLHDLGELSLEHARWKLCSSGESREPPTPRSLELAHQALAEVHSRQGNLKAALASLLELSLHERAAQLLEAQIASSAPDKDDRRHELSRSLLELVQQAPRRLPSLLRVLDLARRVSSPLLCVVLRVGSMAAPLSSMALRWGDCTSGPERLLWLQAVTELTLHLLVLLQAQHGADASSKALSLKLQEHARRPSLGTLAVLVALLSPTPRAPLQTQEAANRAINPWNNLLHGVGAWRNLNSMRPDDLEASTEQVAKVSLGLLELLEQLGGPAAAVAVPDGTTGPQDPEGLALPDGTWLVRRGVINGQVRYWSFDQLRCDRRPVDDPSAALSPFSPSTYPESLPSLARQNLPLARLPTPIAEALLALKKGQPPLLQLAWLDEATQFLFRLALPDLQAAREAAEKASWPRLNHKRSQLEAILHDASKNAWLGAFLREETGRRRAFDLIEILEHLEHAPGPFSAWKDWLDLATRLLGALVQASPWVHQNLTLLGRTSGSLQPLRFIDLHPKPTTSPWPFPLPDDNGSLWIFSADGPIEQVRGVQVQGEHSPCLKLCG